jgi:hypothetical protein
MLLPDAYAWTRRQRWLIVACAVIALVGFSAVVYAYERYYCGPDYHFFIGTWRGELECLGEYRTGYRFNADHTYDERLIFGDEEDWIPGGKWYAGGDFVYLRHRVESASGVSYDVDAWHIDSMIPNKVRMHHEMLYGTFERVQ